ncbi:hypothetical protein JQK15_20095 [Sphingobium sp. BHU LFT2]|uniref:hypothetical protein n=1 Tax=Sphingobium sp. BHU LFT2 TaxID=2807634 RepID=UPI001BEC3D4F|nr:hypothetical protein [Sphingobium sp. BHU LFT2]MBT2245819.1 hypothetical protein [Sphingobium sp. BHU LFT2]
MAAGLGMAIAWIVGRAIYTVLEYAAGLSTPPAMITISNGRQVVPIGPAKLARDLPFVVLLCQCALAFAAALLLQRSRNLMRQVGWGLLAFAAALLLTWLLPLIQRGPLFSPIRKEDIEELFDLNYAPYLLLYVGSYILPAIAAIICGIWLLCKGAARSAPNCVKEEA